MHLLEKAEAAQSDATQVGSPQHFPQQLLPDSSRADCCTPPHLLGVRNGEGSYQTIGNFRKGSHTAETGLKSLIILPVSPRVETTGLLPWVVLACLRLLKVLDWGLERWLSG